jgi:hypothetical protein
MELIIALVSFLMLLQRPVHAVNSTSSAITNDKVETLTDKLKDIVKGATTQEESTTSDNKPKSFFGTITQISDQQMTINTQNKNLILQLNDNITYIDTKRQKSKLANFKVGQTILSMGYLDQNNTLDCRRIIATESKSIENNNQVVTGKIVDVSQSQSSPIFVLIPFQNKNGQYQIKIDSKTEFSDIGQKKLTSADVVVNGKKIIAVIQPDAKVSQTFYASRIISLDIVQSPTPTVKP